VIYFLEIPKKMLAPIEKTHSQKPVGMGGLRNRLEVNATHDVTITGYIVSGLQRYSAVLPCLQGTELRQSC
jgi:hypothetical protein